MSKFTAFVLVLIIAICLMFTGLIVYEDQKVERDFITEQQKNIPESIDQETLDKAKTVEEEAQPTADEALEAADDDKKELVSEYGDTVTIDYVGISGGEEFEGGTAQDYSIEIGSNSFVQGYELQLEDHKIGDVVEVMVTFPEDYSSEDLAGQDALFVVTIKDIQKG